MDDKRIIGMVHLLPLPGSPSFGGNMERIYDRARKEAEILSNSDFDGLIVENYGDTPYPNGTVGPTQLAAMAAVCRDISSTIDIDVGVNVQFNDYTSELAIAKTCRCDFIRVEVFSETVLTGSGLMEGAAADVMQTREDLEPRSNEVELLVDVLSKGVTPLKDEPLQRVVKRTESNGADGIIVTGSGTGKATPLDFVREAKKATDLPVYVGSGLTADKIAEVLEIADGGIVGSALKVRGKAENRISPERAREFIANAS